MTTVTCNALALRPAGTGVQTYIRHLLPALRAATDVDLRAVVQADAVDQVPPGITPQPRRPSDGIRRGLESLRPVGPTDLVHGLDVDLPVGARAPLVATVHDCSVFDVPWTFGRVRATAERLVVRQALRRADAVIAVSTFTAERVAVHFGIEATVVLEGAPPMAAAADLAAVASCRVRLGLPGRFVLHVGSVEPRKDLPTLSAAARRAGLALVLAGPGTDAAAGRLGAVGLGYVAADDLPLLYAAADAVGYPSRYEGFGLPPLEAMAAGTPVVASNAASLPEVLGDGALFAPVGDVDAWAAALCQLRDDADRRNELVAAGRRRVEALTWPAAATGTLAVYRSLGVAV